MILKPYQLLLCVVILTCMIVCKQRNVEVSTGNRALDTLTNTLEMDALTAEEESVSFNVLYIVSFDNHVLKKLEQKDKEELNSNTLEPVVRSHIRRAVAKIKKAELADFPNEMYKMELKKELKSYEIDLIRFVATKRKSQL